MILSDFSVALAFRFPNLLAKDTNVAVQEIIDAIGQSLIRGERVEVRGFGSFGVNYRPACQGLNPKTGEAVSVTAKYVPYFKAGKEIRVRVEESVLSEKTQLAA